MRSMAEEQHERVRHDRAQVSDPINHLFIPALTITFIWLVMVNLFRFSNLFNNNGQAMSVSAVIAVVGYFGLNYYLYHRSVSS